MQIHIVHGANLNLLGKREPHIYGSTSFETYFAELQNLFPTLNLAYFQSNHEGELIDYLQKIGFDAQGIVLNAGAYTHTSIAIADTLAAISAPVVEVHISHLLKREAFRHHSFLAKHCVGLITGLGLKGYELAIRYLIESAQKNTCTQK